MSTGYGWEGIRQVRATLLGACHVPERLWGGSVYLGRYNKCSTFAFFISQKFAVGGQANLACVFLPGLYHNSQESWQLESTSWRSQRWKREKTNGILLRNRQIHDIIGQISPSYVFGCHGLWPSQLWPSWSLFVAVLVCGHHFLRMYVLRRQVSK